MEIFQHHSPERDLLLRALRHHGLWQVTTSGFRMDDIPHWGQKVVERLEGEEGDDFAD
jgi:hypothetical protein